MPAVQRPISANLVLAVLSRPAYQRMEDSLNPVELSYGQVLYEPRGTIDYVYFPVNSLVSLLTAVDNQRNLEVGMVGNEGMVGMPMVLGIGVSAVRALVQGSGTAMRMTAVRFRAEFKKNIVLQQALFRYTHLLMAQVSQTAACNRAHSMKQRCARWLLMSSDRIRSDVMPMTHEFLSSMLGVRRTGVTAIAEELQRSELIRYHRGQVTIVDHAGLEAAACECYRIDHARLEQRL